MKQSVKVELWRLALAVLWIGLVGAISFIEAPLKFQAPGITIPLGLGIGRLVFFALNVVEAMLLIVTTVLAFWPRTTRLVGARIGWWAALAAVFIAKITIIRPPLNTRTDLVLAGADPGQSPWHYIYIAADLLTLALLIVLAAQAARGVLRSVASADSVAATSHRH